MQFSVSEIWLKLSRLNIHFHLHSPIHIAPPARNSPSLGFLLETLRWCNFCWCCVVVVSRWTKVQRVCVMALNHSCLQIILNKFQFIKLAAFVATVTGFSWKDSRTDPVNTKEPLRSPSPLTQYHSSCVFISPVILYGNVVHLRYIYNSDQSKD